MAIKTIIAIEKKPEPKFSSLMKLEFDFKKLER